MPAISSYDPINTPPAPSFFNPSHASNSSGIANSLISSSNVAVYPPHLESRSGISYPIDDSSYTSKNFGERRNNATIDTLVLHYTAASFQSSMNTFCNGTSVSTHYVIPDTTDPSYHQGDMQIFRLVNEDKRAWHAGVGEWQQRSDVNSRSIVIEIINLAKETNGNFTFPPYKTDQIRALEFLVRDILVRNPHITLKNVIAHSDMTSRKSDPGPQFPWESLGRAGLSAWYSEAQRDLSLDRIEAGTLPTDKSTMIAAMAAYGYPVTEDMTDIDYKQMLRAFQMHFCPQEAGDSGAMSNLTAATLYALCCEHCPDALPSITNCSDLLETTTAASSTAPRNTSLLAQFITSVHGVWQRMDKTWEQFNRLGVGQPPPIDWEREQRT